MNMDAQLAREVSPCDVDHASSLTFAQVRGLAVRRGMTLRDLVTQFQRDVERPREVFARVSDKKLDAVVMPYGAVIQGYEKATAPVLAMTGESACVWVRSEDEGAAELGGRLDSAGACRERHRHPEKWHGRGGEIIGLRWDTQGGLGPWKPLSQGGTNRAAIVMCQKGTW